jgi:glycerophosphoryl diester phosphodiesterase
MAGSVTAAVHPYLSSGRADVLAHRGASGECPPGNTWAAFERAVDVGVDHIETDVQISADGVIVVYHDDRLDATTTGRGTIGEHGWDHLGSLRYRADGQPTEQGLVRLDELLVRWPQVAFNIDVKVDDAVTAVVDLLRRIDAGDRVCVASFGWRRIRRLRSALGDGWCTAAARGEIVVARVASWTRVPVALRCDVLQVPPRAKGVTVVDRRFVDWCHRAGIAVHVWTVDDPDEAQRLCDLGVDALITDHPERFVER